VTIENKHWRGSSVSAELFRATAERHGITCLRQEIVNWGCDDLTDCFTTFARSNDRLPGETEIIENPGFMDEAIRFAAGGEADS